ncbi:hypothetical protein LSCM1_07821 [Leishmania martiniquensis]|uniref:FYVE-type domain-containing protein n=1 Tax=Leishmania martiniquensis TaxID=1580590 RepID=A0A836GLY9_9TRYP|nr:hypothetical protein LSCM1_07821 [Leishmania martiniquensis]
MSRGTSSFQAVPENQWPAPSSIRHCTQCGKPFGLFQAADNCHGCGHVCCPGCLTERLVLPGQPGSPPVPVCTSCAKAIKRTLEEAEMAVHRCHLLEEMLNEQATQAEKLRHELREQREENKLLMHEKESLKATIARMEIEAEVAAAKLATAAAAATVCASTPAHSPVASPSKADTAMHLNASTSAESAATMEEALNKKKRQLDVREATLKDALKKVSADAAKIADQRAALQEQEKLMTSQLTAQFTSLFEEERQRLEDLCVDAITDVQRKYMGWVAQQQDGALERRRRYEQAMEEHQLRVTAELAEVREERDALQRELESQRVQLAELKESASRVAVEGQMEAKTAALSSPCPKEKKPLEEAVEEGAACAAAAERQCHATQTELDSTNPLCDEERRASGDAAAADAALQQRLQESMEALKRDMRSKEQEWERAKAAAVATAESTARLVERKQLELEVEKVRQRSRKELEEAVRRAKQDRDAAVYEIRGLHQREKEEWLSEMRHLRGIRREEEVRRQRQDNAWRGEKAALQKKCDELAVRLEERMATARQLQQQLRDVKAELSDLKRSARDKGNAALEERRKCAHAAAAALQRSASALLEEVKEGQERMLAEQAGALALLNESMQQLVNASCAASKPRDVGRRDATQSPPMELEGTRQEAEAALEKWSGMRESVVGMVAEANEGGAELSTLGDMIQSQQRAFTELQQQHQRTLDELLAARAAASPSTEPLDAVAPAVNDACYDTLIRLEQGWVQQRAITESLYLRTLYAVMEREWTLAIDSITSSLAVEAERQRGSRLRNAKVLENTTSTIKEVQSSLRLRTQELLQREADIEERERRVQKKKKRVDDVCRSLYVVAQELRQKYLGAAENAAVEEVMTSARSPSESL